MEKEYIAIPADLYRRSVRYLPKPCVDRLFVKDATESGYKYYFNIGTFDVDAPDKTINLIQTDCRLVEYKIPAAMTLVLMHLIYAILVYLNMRLSYPMYLFLVSIDAVTVVMGVNFTRMRRYNKAMDIYVELTKLSTKRTDELLRAVHTLPTNREYKRL